MRGHWLVAFALLGTLAVLGVGVLVAWWRGVLLRRPEPDGVEPERVCGTCARRYPAGARYCAADATPLSWLEGDVGDVQLHCPRCEVVYEAGLRFCAMDAEPLVRLEDPADARPHDLHGSDVICPVCAARYAGPARFCGRDGTRLCSLH